MANGSSTSPHGLSRRRIALTLAACTWAGAATAAPITATSYVDNVDAGSAAVVASSYAQPCIASALPVGVNCSAAGSPTPTNLHYNGFTRRLTSVSANSITYYPVQAAPARVVVNRNSQPALGHDPNRVILFYDLADSSGGAAANIADPADIYLRAPYVKTIAEAFQLSVLNLGIDNIFQNAAFGGDTNNFNNIESMEFVFAPAIAGSDLSRNGFAVIERGGNDAFRISGLRGVDGSCTSFTRLPQLAVPASAWSSAADIYTRGDVIGRRDPASQAEIRIDNRTNQTLKGLFYTFAELGFAAGDTVCGYAVYGQDSSGTDPFNPAQNPVNTSSTNILDLAASVSMYAADTDMRVELGALPAAIGPGRTLTGLSLTCTNIGATTAAAASCAVSADAGSISNFACTPPAGGSVAPGASISCSYDFTAPGTPGGGTEPLQRVTLSGTTGASNDTNPANNAAQAPIPLIDARDDLFGPVGPAGSTDVGNVLGNDVLDGVALGAGLLSVVSDAGPGTVPLLDTNTGIVSVPPATPPGNYTITYRVCAALPPVGCDTATATVSVVAPPLAGPPLAGDDQSLGHAPGSVVTVAVLGNDSSDPSPLDSASIRIVGPSGPVTSLVVSGEGQWQVDTVAGTIVFTPQAGFTGNPTPIRYTVANQDGTVSESARVVVGYAGNASVAPIPVDAPWALLMLVAAVPLAARRFMRV